MSDFAFREKPSFSFRDINERDLCGIFSEFVFDSSRFSGGIEFELFRLSSPSEAGSKFSGSSSSEEIVNIINKKCQKITEIQNIKMGATQNGRLFFVAL